MRLNDLWVFVGLMMAGKTTSAWFPGSIAEITVGILAVGWIGWMFWRVYLAKGN